MALTMLDKCAEKYRIFDFFKIAKKTDKKVAKFIKTIYICIVNSRQPLIRQAVGSVFLA